jgi:hypothetical protein
VQPIDDHLYAMLLGLGYQDNLGYSVACNDSLAGAVPRAWAAGAPDVHDHLHPGWAAVFDGSLSGELTTDDAQVYVYSDVEHQDGLGDQIVLGNATADRASVYIGAWWSDRYARYGGAVFSVDLSAQPRTLSAEDSDTVFLPRDGASNTSIAHPFPDVGAGGVADVVVAHSHTSVPSDALGRLVLHRGDDLSPLTPYEDAEVVYTDSSEGNLTGRSLAVLDLDGDGHVDMLHADTAFDGAGRLVARFGPLFDADPSEQPLGADIVWWADPQRGGIVFGNTFDVADLDGDGHLDIAISDVSMPVDGLERAGQAFVFFGPFQRGDSLEVGQADVRIDGDIRGASLGYLVTADHDGDGHDDLVVVQSNHLSGECPAEVHIYRGPLQPGVLVAGRDADLTYTSDQVATGIGVGMAACDLDGDGRDELVLGDYGFTSDDVPGRGRVQVIEGWDRQR